MPRWEDAGVQWGEFTKAAPELARLGTDRFQAHELCMLGTLRANGWPRISPCELDLVGGQLLLGMMWHSPKALDLLRDSRCVLHSCTSDRAGTEGDFKLYGHGVDQSDPRVRDEYCQAIQARIEWQPTEPFHLFSIDVMAAAYLTFGDHGYGIAWDGERGLRRWSQREE
ncbi:MAG TPA: pyridoxamine 5'-phosphate oxidase [Solirubrobacteraceae bacterium]|nr:pyridoxamine 5'-phosphate oxidase [Solirubrobacteraceae bacterium]